jgi:hypothetical protein
MKFKDVIANLDKSECNRNDAVTWDLSSLQLELSICQEDVCQDSENPRLTCYWVANHCCTDTWVGFRAYFLDGEFVAQSYQPARKSDESFEWTSKESAFKVRDYILSLSLGNNDFDVKIMENIEQEMDIGYQVQYAGELIKKKVIYENQQVTVVQQPRDIDGKMNFHTVKIQYEDGKQEFVDIRELTVPWHTKGN